jgi:pyridoxamine 5'-phosphate oxidase
MSSDDIFKKTRKEYERGALDETSVVPDPIAQFRRWFDEAMEAESGEANACALSTVGSDGRPSSRMVLLKSLEDEGLVFFTNYGSKKGRHLLDNPYASLLFYWPALERQVRFEGGCSRTTSEYSDSYFRSRPRSAQLGAVVSQQSRVVESRGIIDSSYASVEAKMGTESISRPENWGGFKLVPSLVEFWQGRESRLHDRIQYERIDEEWRRDRLWP